MIVATDGDEILINLHFRWLELYRVDYKHELYPEHIDRWSIQDLVLPECGDKIFEYLEHPDLYKGATLVEGAKEAVETLRNQGHRVVVVTASSHPDKERLLYENGIIDKPHRSKDYVVTNSKDLIRADFLIDDYYLNLTSFQGHRILLSRPHNLSYDEEYHWQDNIHRYVRWSSIVKFIGSIDSHRKETDSSVSRWDNSGGREL